MPKIMYLKRSPSKSPSKAIPRLPIFPTITVEKEGWLNKKVVGALTIKNWRPIYFYLLMDGAWIGFDTKPDNPLNAEQSHNYTVKGCQFMLRENPKTYSFVIRGLDYTKPIERTFYVDSDQDRQEWLDAIVKVRDSLARNSSCSSSSSISNYITSFGDDWPGCTSNDQELIEKFAMLSASEEEPCGKKKLTFDNFERLNVVGRGAFGKVVLCQENETGRLYAMKTMLKEAVIKKDKDVDHCFAENSVLQRTNHPFIMLLKCCFQSPERLFFVTEFVNGGELFIHLKREGQFTEDKTRFYGAEIVSAIGYLHENEIIYRDLKPENLLLDKFGHIKMVDFGLCKEKINYEATTNTFCGSSEYLAPEVLDSEEYGYGLAVDWWGLGVVMYEMIFGKVPFLHQNKLKQYQLILTRQLRFPYSTRISTEARDLLSCLLEKDPVERLGGGPDDAQPVMRHPFFRSINWDDLYNKKIDPPFIPQVTSDTDLRYFDKQFTRQSVELTPPATNQHLEVQFINFSYENIHFGGCP